MTDSYEERGACARCLRSSVVASLIGFILVLIGGGAYGGATIFARRYFVDLLEAPHLCPKLDYVIYGLVGAVGLFTVLAYILCALSSGWNAKSCFESRVKSACGRCCNMTLILLLVCAVLLWAGIASLMSYPVISIAILSHRTQVPDPASALNMQPDMGKLVENIVPSDQFENPAVLPEWPNTNVNSAVRQNSPWTDRNVKRTKRNAQSGVDQLGSPESWADKLDSAQLPDNLGSSVNSLPTVNEPSLDKKLEVALPDSNLLGESLVPSGKVLEDAAKQVQRVGSHLLACSPTMLDLSYYGLYDENGSPVLISRAKFNEGIKQVFVCVCISLAGIFLLLLGYLQIVICTAINYARLQDTRYYDPSEAGEEGVALQQ